MSGLVMQVAERLTALKSACTALEASSTGKASGAKLQKALAKLQKVENPLASQPQTAALPFTPHVPAPQAAAAASQMLESGHGSAAVPAESNLPHVSSTVLLSSCSSPSRLYISSNSTLGPLCASGGLQILSDIRFFTAEWSSHRTCCAQQRGGGSSKGSRGKG